MSSDSIQHLQSLDRFWALIKIDGRDISILVSYTLVTGLLSLAVPLAAQAVVNTIAAGIFLQPLAVMTALLFAGLLFVAILRMLKRRLAETLQQRIFARVVMQLGARIPKIQTQALSKEYMPELVNRFFDVMTVQKAWGKLLLDVPVILQFAGWPALQFAVWPSVAVGTFGGKVAVIDACDDGRSNYRVIVRPDTETRQGRDEPWPSSKFLRPGAEVTGWIMLDTVPVGFELWRQFNAFPPTVKPEELGLSKGTPDIGKSDKKRKSK